MKKIAVIMAGGTGAKLWPRSTEKQPKQFIHLIGEGTLIQNTFSRLLPYFDIHDIYVVTSLDFSQLIKEQLPVLSPENLITEPFPRGTASCLALCLSVLSARYSEDTVLMAFPADHIISNVIEFHNSLEIACKVAHDKKGIVTVGIKPSRPETAFGYIQVKNQPLDLDESYNKGVRYTTTFAEKPDKETALRFINSGDFLWNSGMFITRFDTFWNSFEKFLPDHFKLFKVIRRLSGMEMFDDAVQDAYQQMESVSIDYAILEKAGNVFVVETYFAWSDVGNWDEIYRISLKDARNNVIHGNVVSSGISNCFIQADEKLIGIAGVENLIVIDSGDTILICKKGNSEAVQEIVDYLRRKQIHNYL